MIKLKNKQLKPISKDKLSKKIDFTIMKKLESLDTLMKLRLIVSLIFSLSTIAIILIFITDFWIPVFLFLISYILVLIFMIKLLLIKKL